MRLFFSAVVVFILCRFGCFKANENKSDKNEKQLIIGK
jgi:hypothetical protein